MLADQLYIKMFNTNITEILKRKIRKGLLWHETSRFLPQQSWN